MKQTITKEMFIRRFKDSLYRKKFSVEGLSILYDYLVEFEKDTGQELEFDIVAITCDFTEYDDLGDLIDDYLSDEENIESWEDAVDKLLDYTIVLPIYDGAEIVGAIVQEY